MGMYPNLQALERGASGSRTVGRAPRRSLSVPQRKEQSLRKRYASPRTHSQVLQSKDTGLGALWLLVWPDTGRWQALAVSLLGRQN